MNGSIPTTYELQYKPWILNFEWEWAKQESFTVLTISSRCSSGGVQGEVELLSEQGPVVSVNELKHTLMDHIRLRRGHATLHQQRMSFTPIRDLLPVKECSYI